MYVIFWHFNKDEPMFNTTPLWKLGSIVKYSPMIDYFRRNMTTQWTNKVQDAGVSLTTSTPKSEMTCPHRSHQSAAMSNPTLFGRQNQIHRR